MQMNCGKLRVGFELEVMFTADGYPELVEISEQKGFCWESNDGTAPVFMRKVIAQDLSEKLGVKVHAPAKDSLHPTTRWAIKEEYDVENGAYIGVPCAVEIVSPPMEVDVAKSVLSMLFDFCIDKGGFTDSNCGLHMTFDMDKKYGSSLPLMLALKLDERAILEDFGREQSNHTTPQRDKLVVEAAAALVDGNQFALDEEFLEHVLGMGKCFAINLEKLDRYGIVEFRHCGGDSILYSDEPVCDVIDTIVGTIRSIQDDLDELCTGDEYSKYIESNISEAVKSTVSYLGSFQLSKPEGVFIGMGSYDVTFKDRKVGEICQLSPACFAFHAQDDFPSYTSLVVDSLSKAKALTAMTIWQAEEFGGKTVLDYMKELKNQQNC